MIRVRYPLLYIVGAEEEPVEQVLHKIHNHLSYLVSSSSGVL